MGPQETLVNLCEEARKRKPKDLARFFSSPEAMEEFEFVSFKDFLKNNKLAFQKAVAPEIPDETGPWGGSGFVRVFYSYKPETGIDFVSSAYTWFPFEKMPESGDWKISSKGAYLRRIAALKGWRRIEGKWIRHYFDYSIKKSMDAIHAECCEDEYRKILQWSGREGPPIPLDYFVYDDEKSLAELGIEAGTSGAGWVFSNHPCDLFQLCSHVLRMMNGAIPRFFLYGVSAYYAQFIAEGRYPVFNVSQDTFSEEAARLTGKIPPEKISRLVSNVQFDRWAQYVAFISIVSRSRMHPHGAMLLIACSFIKFLFEAPEIGISPTDRKERIMKILAKSAGDNFADLFKESMGIKLGKADKLWRKSLKKSAGTL